MPFPQKPSVIKKFSDGLNHQTYLITCADKLFVLKLFSAPSPQAISAQKIAAQNKLAPGVLYVNESFDVALFEYIDEQSLDSKNLSDTDLITLATGLQQLHSISTDKLIGQFDEFDLTTTLETYLQAINPSDKIIRRIHQRLKPAIDHYLSDPTKRCFCHNDLVAENCFIASRQALYIDWEYAQINNPWFDIAALIYYFNLSQGQVELLLKHYRPNWEAKANSPILYASLCALLWCDILWHRAKGHSEKRADIERKIARLSEVAAQLSIHI